MHRMLRTGILITFGILIIGIIIGCGEDPSEDVTDLPKPKDDVPQLPKITVMVDPPPGSDIDEGRTEFKLRFSNEVAAVTVNGVTATGSGQNWSVWASDLLLEWKAGQVLEIEWKTRDGSTGCRLARPYNVYHVSRDPPRITHGTVNDGAVDVDPAPINAGGFRFDFNEPITGTIKLTDKEGVDLNWTSAVVGQTATLTAIAGQELANETTYKIEIDVQDAAGTRTEETITFVTKPK